MTTPPAGINVAVHDSYEGSFAVLSNRFLNKGTAFTMEEREALGIVSRLPPAVETLEQQVDRVVYQLELLEKPINKYQLLRNVQATNATLYYATLLRQPELLLPVIYTPTVGLACQKFGSLYQREHGMYVSSSLRGRISSAMQSARYSHVDVIVITDGSRILGLGDLGASGMGIPVGKCCLYVVGGGLHPRRVLPVLLDAGTDNESLRNDPMYLGQRIPRLPDSEYYPIMDEFMEAVKELWPNATTQFEDFSTPHCFDLLERYQHNYRCFNDDIQGTGAVISAGFANAVKISGVPLEEHRVIVFGAGSAAVGVAKSIAALIAHRKGTNERDAWKMFYLVDTKGLVTTTRGDKLAPHKVDLARHDIAAEDNHLYANLLDIIKLVRPTALLGLGGAGPAFTQEMIELMCSYCPRPIVFPLSNPTSKAEIIPADAFVWSNGKAIVASGSPFPGVEVNGIMCAPSQGNNMYIFPGVGLAASVGQPSYIPEELLVLAAATLETLATEEQLAKGLLYPPISEIRTVSLEIATALILRMQEVGLGGALLPKARDELREVVRASMYVPAYESAYHADTDFMATFRKGGKH